MNTELQDYSHKRLNVLTGEWVLVSPHRAKRPWKGQNEELSKEIKPSYDESCYLCPTNARINGEINPDYDCAFVFTNDFPALQKDSPSFFLNEGLLQAQSETGICKVICFSPDHSKSLAEMSIEAIEKVVSTWKNEYETLGQEKSINYVQIFENKGAVMGCSNPHPHGQIWSQSSLPNEVYKKDVNQRKYFEQKNTTILEDYVQQELILNERIIFEKGIFCGIVTILGNLAF